MYDFVSSNKAQRWMVTGALEIHHTMYSSCLLSSSLIHFPISPIPTVHNTLINTLINNIDYQSKMADRHRRRRGGPLGSKRRDDPPDCNEDDSDSWGFSPSNKRDQRGGAKSQLRLEGPKHSATFSGQSSRSEKSNGKQLSRAGMSHCTCLLE